MANQQSLTVTASLCRLYVNNRIYAVTQDVTVTQDIGSYAIYGINSPYAQEIATGGQTVIRGSASVIRTKNSGGLQATGAVQLFSNLGATNYASLRLEDRSTGETLWSIPKAQISNIRETVSKKGLYNISFDFIGQILYYPLDLS
jgi:hypothetical protein